MVAPHVEVGKLHYSLLITTTTLGKPLRLHHLCIYKWKLLLLTA